VALADGAAAMLHAVIDEHCPGAHGCPHPSCWPSPPQSPGLVGLLAASEVKAAAFAE
jgi:hypothetical protein